MNAQDAEEFKRRLAGVFAIYSRDLSEMVLSIWWESLRKYDLAAVASALNRHAVNPDNGQYLPKPADIVKLIEGGTVDSSLVAWSKVDRAIRSIGPYQSVVFDDPIIQAVVQDMGGWVQLCNSSEQELPFKGKEFQTRYRAYKTTASLQNWPTHLPGIAEGQNAAGGFRQDPPVMIGNPEACRRVYEGGNDQPALTFQPLKLREALEAIR